MATINPFTALRYDPEKAGAWPTICCPPYDIIPLEDQPKLEAENPYNCIRLERPLGEDRYVKAGQTLRAWKQSGILRSDVKPAYYLYRIDFMDRDTPRAVWGFLARVKTVPFSEGVILPHEETLSKDKSDRFSLMEQTLCNISPVYGLYRDEDGAVEMLLQAAQHNHPAEADFEMEDGARHRLWPIVDPAVIGTLTAAFAPKQIIIADGHHRYETALDFAKTHTEAGADCVMMMLVSMQNPGLVIWPTHRLLHNLTTLPLDALSAHPAFRVEKRNDLAQVEQRLAEQPHRLALYLGGENYYLFTLQKEAAVKALLPNKSDDYCSLDVSILHTLLLEPILGIDKENMAAQKNLRYTRSLQEALASVCDRSSQAAFLLPPTRIGEIDAVAGHGERMPQKSTYFYPKLITGLVINCFMEA